MAASGQYHLKLQPFRWEYVAEAPMVRLDKVGSHLRLWPGSPAPHSIPASGNEVAFGLQPVARRLEVSGVSTNGPAWRVAPGTAAMAAPGSPTRVHRPERSWRSECRRPIR